MADWLLDCTPRSVQVEALSRSYDGFTYCDRLGEGQRLPVCLPHGSISMPARGWGHFMEMRLGKTPVALNEYLLLKRDHGIDRALILAPNKFKRTWKSEAERFGVDVPIHVYEAREGERRFRDFMRRIGKYGPGILVANYEAMLHEKHRARIYEFVDNANWLLVLDESAIVKTHTSQTTKRVTELAKGACYKRALSGMPAPYAPYDLWSQLRILGLLDKYANFYVFKHTFTRLGGWKNKQALGIQNEQELDEFLFHKSFRAKKVDLSLIHISEPTRPY